MHPVNLQREAFRRHPDQMPEPPQLAPLYTKEQQLYSELPLDVRAPHPISNAEPGHSTEEARFSCLYPPSRSLSHYPKLKGWNVDGPKNRELHFPRQTSTSPTILCSPCQSICPTHAPCKCQVLISC